MENEENQKQVSRRFPQPLEIAAIPTFPQPRRRPRGKVEIQKQDSHFPTAAYCPLQISERRILLMTGFPVVQAHPSIRICWGYKRLFPRLPLIGLLTFNIRPNAGTQFRR